MLSSYDWIYGVVQLAVGFLAVISALIVVSMFSASQRKELKAWKFLLIALLLFALVEVFGGLAAFGILDVPFLTHVTTGALLAFLITALAVQIQINRGWMK